LHGSDAAVVADGVAHGRALAGAAARIETLAAVRALPLQAAPDVQAAE